MRCALAGERFSRGVELLRANLDGGVGIGARVWYQSGFVDAALGTEDKISAVLFDVRQRLMRSVPLFAPLCVSSSKVPFQTVAYYTSVRVELIDDLAVVVATGLVAIGTSFWVVLSRSITTASLKSLPACAGPRSGA
jgi:hypothetical protein